MRTKLPVFPDIGCKRNDGEPGECEFQIAGVGLQCQAIHHDCSRYIHPGEPHFDELATFHRKMAAFEREESDGMVEETVRRKIKSRLLGIAADIEAASSDLHKFDYEDVALARCILRCSEALGQARLAIDDAGAMVDSWEKAGQE